jgi:hypothetical protein
MHEISASVIQIKRCKFAKNTVLGKENWENRAANDAKKLNRGD